MCVRQVPQATFSKILPSILWFRHRDWELPSLMPLLPAHPFLGDVIGSSVELLLCFHLLHELKVPIWFWPPGRKWLSTRVPLHPQPLLGVFQSCLYSLPLPSQRASWNFAMCMQSYKDVYSLWPRCFTSRKKWEENNQWYSDMCMSLFSVVIFVTLVTLQYWKLPKWAMEEWLIQL